MNKKTKKQQDDIIFEEEETTSFSTCEKKLKKIKKELAECKKEKAEYLDSLQRLKADFVNSKKDFSERLAKVKQQEADKLVAELIPVADSFDMAFSGDAWEKVDGVWRQGIEYIHSQLISVLNDYGIEQFGKEGDKFDPEFYEATKEEVTDKYGPGTVSKVLQKGYKSKDSLIRPARVIVTK